MNKDNSANFNGVLFRLPRFKRLRVNTNMAFTGKHPKKNEEGEGRGRNEVSHLNNNSKVISEVIFYFVYDKMCTSRSFSDQK